MEQQQQQQHNFHVLVVDDNRIERKLLERHLKLSSYQVTCVDCADKALEYLGLPDDDHDCDSSSSLPSSSSSSHSSQLQEELKINLIMTDYSMPGMTGYDLLQRLKRSSWKDVPVVVMSSDNVPSRINKCLEGGAVEFLLKPIKSGDLKKIEPHLLKSVKKQQSSCAIDNNNETKRKNTSSIKKSIVERGHRMKGLVVGIVFLLFFSFSLWEIVV